MNKVETEYRAIEAMLAMLRYGTTGRGVVGATRKFPGFIGGASPGGNRGVGINGARVPLSPLPTRGESRITGITTKLWF